MRHKLLYLLALALTATSSGWGQEDSGGVPSPFSTQQIDKTDLKNTTGLFANGHAITIETGSSEGKIKVSTTDMGTNISYETDGASTVVFGGKYNESCESSSITMKSGTVKSIVGGGYGTASESVAKVTTTNIYLEGGTVSNFIVGGGALWSEVTTANIQTQGEGTFTHNSWMIPAMESGSSNNSNGKYPEYDKATCKVENFNVTLNKGTYWIIALAGGNGHYAYTKNGKASIKGTADDPVVIRGGLFGCGSNGRGDTAEAEVEYCDMSGEALELASVNRGKLKSVDFTFRNCTFSDKIYAYLGGTYMWGDQYASSEVGIPESVKFTFDPSCTGIPTVGISEGLDAANVTLTGAKAKIASFARDNMTNITSFTIGAGKTWTFNDGLIIGKDVTFKKYGTLVSAITAEEQAEQTIDQKAIKPYDIYANGTPIEITAYTTDSVQITKQGENTVVFKVPSASSIYGGAKEATVNSTSIKMVSGTVKNLTGGGYSKSADTPANVTGTISIDMKDAKVSNLLVGGGRYYSKANEIDINLTNATVFVLYAGGFDQGTTSNRIDTDLAQSVNGANTVNITMKGGKVSLFGCGGGQGYPLTGTSIINVEGAEIDALYGTLSNGRADKIVANFKNTIFTTGGEIATINRGKVGSGSFTFDGCTINSTGIYLGTAVGWADSDTNGEPLPAVTDKVSYKFTNTTWNTSTPNDLISLSRGLETTDIEVTGAKVLMTYFRDGTKVPGEIFAFTLGQDKTWTFNGGLKCEGDKYTFTKQGILKATAPEASDLLTLASVHADTISLVEATYELPSQLTITKPMILNGAGMDKTFIKAGAADWAHTYDADLNLIAIENATGITPAEGGEVVISNLTVSNAKRNGLNVQTSMAVKLDAVTLKDNTAAGLVVHSKVDATDMHTSGNKWGGVNIAKGTPEYSTLCFTFDANSTFAEKAPIYSELYDQEKIVVVPDNSWERLVQMSNESKGVAMWLKRLIVPAGQTLTADATYANRNVYIENTGILNVTAPLALAKVTMEEGAQLIPTLTDNNKVTATTLQLNTTLKEDKWTAFGFPKAFTLSTADGQTTYTEPTENTNATNGAYFAGLVDQTAPVFEYKNTFGVSGLLSANTGDWQVSATDVEFKAEVEPDAPTTPTFILYANPNTYDMPLTKNKSVYVFDDASNEFVQCTDATKR